MIPIYLDPGSARIAVIGRGAQAARRLGWLREGGANPDVWSDAPAFDLVAAAGEDLKDGLPDSAALAAYHVVWIADLPKDVADALAHAAYEARVLVNVEDVVALCDFHAPAIVRRGKLVLTAGTGGASPAVSAAAREHLQRAFPEAWCDALDDIAEARVALRKEGADLKTLVEDARQRLTEHGLG